MAVVHFALIAVSIFQVPCARNVSTRLSRIGLFVPVAGQESKHQIEVHFRKPEMLRKSQRERRSQILRRKNSYDYVHQESNHLRGSICISQDKHYYFGQIVNLVDNLSKIYHSQIPNINNTMTSKTNN